MVIPSGFTARHVAQIVTELAQLQPMHSAKTRIPGTPEQVEKAASADQKAKLPLP
jgi:hypothetical protein